MAFWSGEKLEARIPADKLITPYDQARVVGCAYEMGVGSEAFITSNPSDATQVAPGMKIAIPPGQFGLLITKEVVFVPDDAIAFISIRGSIKFQGLVNVSGFHVDPGFRGRLKFSVYNAGSKTIVLDQDQPIFMIWYSDLDSKTAKLYQGQHAGQMGITANDVMLIHGEVASPAELKKQMDDLKADCDKRMHAVEKSQAGVWWLVGALVLPLLLLMLGSLVTLYVALGQKEDKPPSQAQPIGKPMPRADE